ncbi:hypothetical protein [Desmospora profundinema]|uniref:Uncharacterized protein n=1 Tax=Desmospora profundinema TaxID=1571184 RepID=A0ABU1ISJ2_9BACL|nr:hypothetical protein [Desmospora profundinema]MDR6227169.1 hypothetical protein [Desmospora profundinema]
MEHFLFENGIAIPLFLGYAQKRIKGTSSDPVRLHAAWIAFAIVTGKGGEGEDNAIARSR